MKALSVRQPWAFAIFRLGKDIENRTWTTALRGDLVIHAAARLAETAPRELLARWEKAQALKDPAARLGVLLGIVEVVDVHRAEQRAFGREQSPWGEPTGWHWRLRNPRLWTEPPSYRGRQLLFEVEVPAGLITADLGPTA